MKNLKVGLIGLGKISSLHTEAIKKTEGIHLYSVCDINKDLLENFCRLNQVKGFTDYRDLLKDGADIIVISLPHYLHYEAGMAALEKGCHLVMEKPFAITMKECRNLFKTATQKNLKVVVADSAYHEPKIRKAREIVQSGKVGCFISGVCINYKDYYFSPERPGWFLDPEKSGGGELMNVGVHRIAAIRAVLGKEETDVKASVINPDKNRYKVEAHGTIFIRYADGTAFVLEEFGYYKLNPGLERCFHFNFENGVINLTDKLTLVYKDGGIEYPEIPDTETSPYMIHYREFLTAVKENKTPYPGALEGIKDVRVILAGYESAVGGSEVKLNTARWTI